jgi:hypothetical protein
MTRRRRDPTGWDELEVVERPDGKKYVRLTEDPDTGGWTRILLWPGGIVNSADHPADFEYHTPQEEIFFLKGGVAFGDFYRADAPAYLNHPPYWLHPAEQRFAPGADATMLVRLSKPIDTFYVPIPSGWNGREYFDSGRSGPPAISVLPLDEVVFGPVFQDGVPTGEEGGAIWRNDAENITTWLWRVPLGWRSDTPSWRVPGASDEVYVIRGDLTITHGGRSVTLAEGSYYCYPDVLYGGGPAHSDAGLLAVRWSSTPRELQLPPIGHTRLVG